MRLHIIALRREIPLALQTKLRSFDRSFPPIKVLCADPGLFYAPLKRIALAQLWWKENLILICQPAHSPGLNLIERVWEFIKHQFTREVFTRLDQLRDRLQQVIEKIILDQICSLSS